VDAAVPTTIDSVPDVAVKLAFPEYAAVIVYVPCVVNVFAGAVQVAVALVPEVVKVEAAQMGVVEALELKATVPAGTAVPVLAGMTTAVNVTCWSTEGEAGEEVTEVVLLSALTT
jgi:hypothetical protein